MWLTLHVITLSERVFDISEMTTRSARHAVYAHTSGQLSAGSLTSACCQNNTHHRPPHMLQLHTVEERRVCAWGLRSVSVWQRARQSVKPVSELHYLQAGTTDHMTSPLFALVRRAFSCYRMTFHGNKVTVQVSLLSWKWFKHVSYYQLKPFYWPAWAACGESVWNCGKKHKSWLR